MKIILGSSSKWRQKVFSQVADDFESMSPDIDEKAIRDSDPEKLTLMIANAKADALLPKISEPTILVTADQVVVFDDMIREKPSSKEQARKFVLSYADDTVEIVNGIVVINTATGKRVEGIDRASISYKRSLQSDVNVVIENSYAVESAGALVTENPIMQAHEKGRTSGEDSYFGIPVKLTKQLIEQVQD
ncbi:MAG TPA: Maf family protein [Patescibacteria group bacterium]|nr:Maf family protein [Patescibacteria group bacterium]